MKQEEALSLPSLLLLLFIHRCFLCWSSDVQEKLSSSPSAGGRQEARRDLGGWTVTADAGQVRGQQQ